jgi:hypothetical protein
MAKSVTSSLTFKLPIFTVPKQKTAGATPSDFVVAMASVVAVVVVLQDRRDLRGLRAPRDLEGQMGPWDRLD